jgi:hypothetical protein
MKKAFIITLALLLFAASANAATITWTWTENQSVIAAGSKVKAAGGSSVLGTIDLDTAGYIGVWITIQVGFGAAADANAGVSLYGSANSGTLIDDQALPGSQEITYEAGASQTMSIYVPNTPYLQVVVYTRDDSGVTVEAVYAGLKGDST